MRMIAVALVLLAGPVRARELKIATWNMDWLTTRSAGDPALPADVDPKTASDRALLRRYALYLDADVVALQEVDGPEVAAQVFPPDRYALFFTDDRVVQRVGFAVKRGLLVRQNSDVAALDVERRRLRSGADITVMVDGIGLRFLAVHLKSGCHEAPLERGRSCGLLGEQIPAMQGWVAQRRAEGAAFVLLGDFNREMDRPEAMAAALAEAAPMLRVTAGRSTPCWGGNTFIDHIFLGGAARGWLEPDSLRVLTYRESAALKDHLSDHCPVSVRLRVPG